MEQGQKEKVKTYLEALRKVPSWSNQRTALLVEEIDKVFWKSPRKTEFADVFCEFGGPELFISILLSNEEKGLFKATGAWEASFIVYNSLYNISETSEKLSGELGEKGMVKLCANNIVRYREKISLKDIESLVHLSLSLLCNLSTWPCNRHIFREEGVLAKMEPYVRMDARLKTICMITSAYIIDESQEACSDGKSGNTTCYLIDILRKALKSRDKRFGGLCDREIAQALGRLAGHDSNKQKIVDNGGLPLLVKMLHDKSTDTQEVAANTIWNLAFADDVRQKLEEEKDCIDTLKKLCQSPESNVSDAANGALWVLTRGSIKKKASTEPEPTSAKNEHVMISYQWGSQPMVLRIRNFLRESGYRVWVDVDHMHGSTLQAMAEAVEQACVVIMCLSERYKDSPNCRTEAEYAFQLRKPIIPVMMEEYYQPDGWLGIILGTKLYMDLSGRLEELAETEKLLREVQNHAPQAKLADWSNNEAKTPQTMTRTSSLAAQRKSTEWTSEEVGEWLFKQGLERWRPALLQFTGKSLHNLCKLRREAPEFFYRSIQDDEALQRLSDIFKFTEALDALNE